MAGNRCWFTRSHRLRTRRAFASVFDARVRESAGPLTIYARPNGLGHSRIGIMVRRELGSAVRRNRVKRLLREAFRLDQHDLPAGYDFVVLVRAHELRALSEYRRLLSGLALKLDRAWRDRQAGGSGQSGPKACRDG